MRARPGCGGAGSSSSLRTPASSRRSSTSASRPVDSIERSAARAWSGRSSNTSSAAAAWTTMTDTECAITSCSSRAMRACSSATARRDPCSIATRRLRSTSPSDQATIGEGHGEPRVLGRAGREVEGSEAEQRGEGRERHAQRPERRHRRDRDQARDREHALRGDQVDHQPAGERDREDDQRIRAAPPQRGALHDRGEEPERDQALRIAAPGRLDEAQQEERDEDRERDVGDAPQRPPGMLGRRRRVERSRPRRGRSRRRPPAAAHHAIGA